MNSPKRVTSNALRAAPAEAEEEEEEDEDDDDAAAAAAAAAVFCAMKIQSVNAIVCFGASIFEHPLSFPFPFNRREQEQVQCAIYCDIER